MSTNISNGSDLEDNGMVETVRVQRDETGVNEGVENGDE